MCTREQRSCAAGFTMADDWEGVICSEVSRAVHSLVSRRVLRADSRGRPRVVADRDAQSGCANLNWYRRTRGRWPGNYAVGVRRQADHHRGRGSTMTFTLPALIVLIVIAAVCGALGKGLAGGGGGGLITSIALGFIGAILGPWVAAQLHLAEPL